MQTHNTLVELAWAGGFYDGEGCMTASKNRAGNPGVPQLTINQAGPDLESPPEVLQRFQDALGGLGTIYGPVIMPNRSPRWTLLMGRWEAVQSAAAALWPHIGSVKRDQITRRFTEYREDAARRAPLHPRARTHCPQNHEYTKENTGRANGSRYCKECNRTKAREYQRRKRATSSAGSSN